MKKQSIALSGAVLTLTVLGSACSTASSSYSLKTGSHDPSDFFKNGLQYHVETQEQVKVSLAFDTMRTRNDAVFETKVTNLGKKKFDFDSSGFSCFLNSKKDPSRQAWGQIQNPEAEILSLQARYEALEPNGWDALMRNLNTVDQITSLGTSRGARRREREAQQNQAQLDLDALNRKEAQRDVISEIRFWRKNSLRKTTLKKGDAVKGAVVCSFKKDDDFDQLVLSLKTEGKSFTWSFDRFQVSGAVPPPVSPAVANAGAQATEAKPAVDPNAEFPEITSLEECKSFGALARDRCREEVFARTKKKH